MNTEKQVELLIDYLRVVQGAQDYDQYNRACDKIEQLLDIRRLPVSITVEKEDGSTVEVGTLSESCLHLGRLGN